MTDSKPILRLDLEPKLNRPLQLWNPLDYLRLLYWIFYFPQALIWYEKKFCNDSLKADIRQPIQLLNEFKKSPIRICFYSQTTIIFFSLSLLLFWILYNPILDIIKINWKLENKISYLLSVICIYYVLRKIFYTKQLRLYFELITFTIALFLPLSIIHTHTYGLTKIGVYSFLIFSFLFSVLLGYKIIQIERFNSHLRNSNFKYKIKLDKELDSILIDFPSKKINFYYRIKGFVFKSIKNTINKFYGFLVLCPIILLCIFFLLSNKTITDYCVITIIFILIRIDDYIIIFITGIITKKYQFIPHITLQPMPFLFPALINSLKQDWEQGLMNLKQLSCYTLQDNLIIYTITKILEYKDPHEIILYLTQLSEGRKIYPYQFLIPLLTHARRLSEDTRIAIAGFLYLELKAADVAQWFFYHIQHLSYGKEMFILAQTLDIGNNVTDFFSLNACTLPAIPPEPLLRPTSWEAIKRFHRAVEDVRLVQRSPSRATRSFALNRALGEVTTIINQQDGLPEAERGLIVQISETWQEILLQETAKIGDFSITEPVRNPYISGSPVIGKRFVGREDIMRKLEETWVMAEQLESVVLFGHRRMGKTSILRNVSTALGSRVKLAYVNLQGLGNNLAEILIEISYEISEVLEISSPNDDDFFKLPYPTFRRYLGKIEKQLDQNKLIIALDEFETIEHLINEGKIDPGFMQFLRTSIQQSPNIAFVLAGLHTLDEMTADYFQPFFASVIPIQVGFMTKGSTAVILANPEDGDFSLDYQRETIDEIYNLTHGQPYLVNLIGFQLVSRYNQQVFEQGYSRDPQFTLSDLNAVIHYVLEQGRYYFTGVWKQATQGEPGQQEILCTLAPYPTGLDRETLSQITNLDLKALDAALTCLEKHDVVIEQNGKFRIIVELFRRWVERVGHNHYP